MNRWIRLIAAVISMAMIGNLQYAWTMCVQPLMTAHHWKLSEVQWGFTVFIAVMTWTMPLSGWFIDKLGPRIMYAFAVAWWSVFTALSAVASGFTSLFGYRLGLGVGESAAYPANAKVVSRWFPIRERAFATSIYDSGARVGTAVSIPLVAFIIAGLGRRASFVITGVIGFIWVVVWFL